jgi:hypothetical protein
MPSLFLCVADKIELYEGDLPQLRDKNNKGEILKKTIFLLSVLLLLPSAIAEIIPINVSFPNNYSVQIYDAMNNYTLNYTNDTAAVFLMNWQYNISKLNFTSNVYVNYSSFSNISCGDTTVTCPAPPNLTCPEIPMCPSMNCSDVYYNEADYSASINKFYDLMKYVVYLLAAVLAIIGYVIYNKYFKNNPPTTSQRQNPAELDFDQLK